MTVPTCVALGAGTPPAPAPRPLDDAPEDGRVERELLRRPAEPAGSERRAHEGPAAHVPRELESVLGDAGHAHVERQAPEVVARRQEVQEQLFLVG